MLKSRYNKNRLLIWILILLFITVCLWVVFNQYEKKQGAHDKIELKDLDIVYGSDKALNVVIMFSSYNCGYCRQFFNEEFPIIMEELIDNGKLKFVVKLVDLQEKEEVMRAYQSAVCINKYGTLEKFDRLLNFNPQVIYTQDFYNLIDDLINRNEGIAECILNGEGYHAIQSNNSLFLECDLTGTPTFVVNGVVFKGYISFSQLNEILN